MRYTERRRLDGERWPDTTSGADAAGVPPTQFRTLIEITEGVYAQR